MENNEQLINQLNDYCKTLDTIRTKKNLTKEKYIELHENFLNVYELNIDSAVKDYCKYLLYNLEQFRIKCNIENIYGYIETIDYRDILFSV